MIMLSPCSASIMHIQDWRLRCQRLHIRAAQHTMDDLRCLKALRYVQHLHSERLQPGNSKQKEQAPAPAAPATGVVG